MKLAFPTKSSEGQKDLVADVFARAPTFTIITVKNGGPTEIEVIQNEAADLTQGTGPLVARTMKNHNVDIVVSGEIGPGASNILETLEIKMIRTETGIRVSEALKKALTVL
jgi:predicted Fe-Mo cluster-binding NifX family protein